MTTIARTPSPDVLLALCCECGATRTVSRRAVGLAESRGLRCKTCQRTTEHAAIGAWGCDWREDLNHEKKPVLSVEDQLDLLRSLGAQVGEAGEDYRDRPSLIASVWHYLGAPFQVIFNPAADQERLARALTEITARIVEPEAKHWYIREDEGGVEASIAWEMPE